MAESNTATRVTGVGRVVIPVTDQDRALEFYTETLGFQKVADEPFGGDQRWVEVAPPGGGTGIALMPEMESTPVGQETGVILTTRDIDAAYSDLQARGADTDEVARMGDPAPPMLFFRDQDGNRLLLVEEPRD